jgi:hypothetical protein
VVESHRQPRLGKPRREQISPEELDWLMLYLKELRRQDGEDLVGSVARLNRVIGGAGVRR